jgi:hypothetical protein
MDSRTRIKELVITFPNISIDEIMVVLKREGYMTSRLAAATIRQDFRQSWKLLHKHGLAEDLDHYQERKQQKRSRNTTKAASNPGLIKRGGNAVNGRPLPDWVKERMRDLATKPLRMCKAKMRQVELDYQRDLKNLQYEQRRAREYLNHASFEGRETDRPDRRTSKKARM